MEADVGEAREGIGDGGEVGREVGAGDLTGVGGYRGRGVRERGRRGPGQPVGARGGGGERVVEERCDGLRDAARGRGGGGGGVGGVGGGGGGDGAEGRARGHGGVRGLG